MKPLYVFDIDGTLALLDQRRHLYYSNDPDKWRKFYEACDTDTPNEPVIKTLNALLDSGAEVWLFTGRMEYVKQKTVAWLEQHTALAITDEQHELVMRREDDLRPDYLVKADMYAQMLECDKQRLVGVFEDRLRVVEMWRRLGVTCFQVSDGRF